MPTPARRLVHRFAPLAIAGLLGLVAWLLHRELRGYHYAEIEAALAAMPPWRVVLALGVTVLSYAALTGYDALALRHLGKALPFRRTALASFVGYAFSHNVGLSALGGAAPRYRLYSAWGLSSLQITALVAFTAATLWTGCLTVAGLAFTLAPAAMAGCFHLPAWAPRPLGLGALALVAGYLAAALVRRRPFAIRGWEIALPAPPVAFTQVALSSADWVVAATVPWVLLPAGASVGYWQFVGLFVVAQMLGLGSNVPGGLGVFEAVMLFVLGGDVPGAGLLGALLVYRAVYYLLPLVVAGCLLGTHELLRRREHLGWLGGLVARWLPLVVPRLLAATTFLGGAILLFSGATPAVHDRLAVLREVLPLPVLELSHFLGSLVGVGLLLLASGLQRRLDAAYVLAVALLAAGAAFSLLKAFDYEEALVLLAMLAALLPCRRYFHRRASLIGERLTPGWSVAVVAVVAASIWLGLFAHRHREYSHELWWELSLYGDAPRFMRASVGVVAGVLVFAVLHLLRPTRVRPRPPDADTLAVVRELVACAPHASAQLVGPAAAHAEMVWRFRQLCDQSGGWPVFYEASAAALPLYLDVGLTALKFGEEARVPLADFTLEGGDRKAQRYVLRRMERDGGTFAVVPPAEVEPLLPALRVVSDDWLEAKRTREKGFSLGSFDPGYLTRFPMALVRVHGTIVAFANLWCSGAHEEAAPDLMRHGRHAPDGVMEYLFLQLVLWARQEGFRWLNLGMAPLAGLESRPLAPLWHRVGAFAYLHGESFYNFQGLRRFKQKFDPEWRPRYLVCPGGLAVPRVLANVAALVSGGIRGVVAR